MKLETCVERSGQAKPRKFMLRGPSKTLIVSMFCLAVGAWFSRSADVAWRHFFDSRRPPTTDYRQRSPAVDHVPEGVWGRLARAEERLAAGAENRRLALHEWSEAHAALEPLVSEPNESELLNSRARFALAQTLEAIAREEPEKRRAYLARARELYEQAKPGDGAPQARMAALSSTDEESEQPASQ